MAKKVNFTKDAMKQKFEQNRSFFSTEPEEQIQEKPVREEQKPKKVTAAQPLQTSAGARGPLPKGIKPINESGDWFVTSIRFSVSQMQFVDKFLHENMLRSRTDSIYLLMKLAIQHYEQNPDKARKDLGI